MKKRMLTMMLALMLIVSVIPFAASAAKVCKTHTFDTANEDTIVEIVLEPTCTERGIYRYKCTKCDETKKFNVEPLGHTEVTLKAKNATCAATGLTAGKKCSVCDEILVAQTEVAKKPHTWDAATAECTKCDAVCDHEGTFDIITPAKDATCTSGPIRAEKRCSVCGYHQEAKATGGALGHSYENSKCTVCGRVCSDHTLKTIEKAQKATCTTPAITARKECQVCDYVEEAKSTGEALGHDFYETQPHWCKVCDFKCDHEGTLVETEEGKPANCYDAEYFPAVECTVCDYTKDGYYYGAGLGHTWENGVCSVCDAECEHDYEVTSSAKAATCDTGYLTAAKKCKICNYELASEEITDPLGHDYNMGYVTTQPTCLEDGVKTYTCKRDNCGHTYTEPVAARGHHVYSTTANLLDTCIYCMTKCDHEDTLVETEQGRPANCYDAEYFPAVECTECNYTKAGYYYGTGLGHDFVASDATILDANNPPTCTEAGKVWHKCSRCDEFKKCDSEALGHDDEVLQEWAATCTTKGCTKTKCKTCELIRYTETDPLGHTMQAVEGLPATCTVDGYTAYEQCATCGLIEGKEVIEAGHEIVGYQCQKCNVYVCDHDGEIETVASTCTTKGSESFSCSICGYHYENELPLADHDYENRCVAATCTTEGLDKYVCKDCGKVTGTGTIAKIAHNYVNGKCSVCQAADPNASTGNSGTNGSETGTGTGTGTVTPACAHKNTSTVRQEKTCTSNGSVVTYCSDCNTVVNTEILRATGHTYVMGICQTCKAQDPSVYTNDYNNYYIVGDSRQ